MDCSCTAHLLKTGFSDDNRLGIVYVNRRSVAALGHHRDDTTAHVFYYSSAAKKSGRIDLILGCMIGSYFSRSQMKMQGLYSSRCFYKCQTSCKTIKKAAAHDVSDSPSKTTAMIISNNKQHIYHQGWTLGGGLIGVLVTTKTGDHHLAPRRRIVPRPVTQKQTAVFTFLWKHSQQYHQKWNLDGLFR